MDMMRKRSKNQLQSDLKYRPNNERHMIVLRGIAGSGKSTFVEQHDLKHFTVSMDDIRKQFLPLEHTEQGIRISQAHNEKVAQLFFDILDYRLSLGGRVVIDNMNLDVRAIKPLSHLAEKYGYNLTVVNFDIDWETIEQRNEQRRGSIKYYQGDLHKRYKSMKDSESAVRRKYNVIEHTDIEAFQSIIQPITHDLNDYSTVKVIGDIHGSYDELVKGLNITDNNLDDDTFYIFLGDYIDRGKDSDKVVHLLIENMSKVNVVLLEGNHEIYLRAYAHNVDLGYGREYDTRTKIQLKQGYVERQDVKKLVNKLKSHFRFTFNGQDYLCTHGGVIDDNIMSLTHFDSVHGIGSYKFNVDEKFNENNDKVIQFHGHRNLYGFKADHYPNSYNLEGGIEQGGMLRIVNIDQNGIKVNEVKNMRVQSLLDIKKQHTLMYIEEVKDNNQGKIRPTSIDGISHVKVNRGYDLDPKHANEKIIRGIFFKDDGEIVLRGYDKFYNLGQVKSTQDTIQSMTYPVIGYKKENGYLGMVSYDKDLDDFVFATKNTIITSTTPKQDNHHYVELLRDMFYRTFNKKQQDLIKEIIMLNRVTFTFEVIHHSDKHITTESEDKLVLLDIIINTIDFKVVTSKKLKSLHRYIRQLHDNRTELKCHLKEIGISFKTPENFEKYINHDKENLLGDTEGYVLYDQSGQMIKYKSIFYLFFKEVRNMLNRIERMEDKFERTLIKEVYRTIKMFKDRHHLDAYKVDGHNIEEVLTHALVDLVTLYRPTLKYDSINGAEWNTPLVVEFVSRKIRKELHNDTLE